MPPPACSPLLALPTPIRQQIFQLVLSSPARPTKLRDDTERATGLLNTCKQIQKEVRLLCVPEDVTELYLFMIQVHTNYSPLTWLYLTPRWVVDGGEVQGSDFVVANLDDSLLMRLVQQIKLLAYVMVYVDEPTEGNPLDSFLLQFAKVQDVVTLLRRFKCCRFMLRVTIIRHSEEYGARYWWNHLEFPSGFRGLTSSQHQGGRYYEYLTMPFAEVGNFEDANAVIRVEELFYTEEEDYPSEFRVFNRLGKDRVLGFNKFRDWVSHRIECQYCRCGKARSKACKKRWKEIPGISKGYARLRTRVNNLAHDLPRLISTCDDGVSDAIDNLRHQQSSTRDSSELNYFSSKNKRHHIHGCSDSTVRGVDHVTGNAPGGIRMMSH